MLSYIAGTQAQIIFQESFEESGLPAGWTIQTDATDGGWIIDSPGALSSQFWGIPSNGSEQIAATNDDKCNCDKGNEALITPPLDFSGLTSVALSVDIFFGKGTYENFSERGTISISTDGINWEELEDIHGHDEWDTHKLDLSAFAGEDSVYIAFQYSDGGGWLYGLAVDNVIVEKPNTLDASLAGLKSIPYGLQGVAVDIAGTILNNGLTPITTLEIDYIINGEDTVSGILEGLNIESFAYHNFVHPTIWTPENEGIYDIIVEITSVNGTIDEIEDNNSLSYATEIYANVVRVNRIDEFLLADPVTTIVATSSDELDKPTDLDFFPILAKNELWIVNERLASSGGSTLTLYDAGTPDQTSWHRVDGNAWHFMSRPTGIAFSNNLNFATSPGIQDANHGGGTFTGPTLWSSDPDIYAQPSGGNGSHLDMLHGSPYCMGIASEVDNVFWVFDSWNKNIVRYDFKEDHGPGNDDHSDGILRRYTEIPIEKDGDIPSHMVIDDATGWLYAVDNGNDRVVRLDIHSGEVVNSLPLINEPLAEHSEMGNVTWEEIITTGLDRPCGIDVIDNRLLVGDYATGDIIIYDTDNGFAELGRLVTGLTGLTGIKIGPDGAIWYTNRVENTVTKMEPGEITSTQDQVLLNQITISPNPTSGLLYVDLTSFQQGSKWQMELNDLSGKNMLLVPSASGKQQLNLGHLPGGVYMLSISNGDAKTVRKIVLTN